MSTTDTLKLALEALEDLQRQYSIYPNSFWDWSKGRGAITAIKQALAAPVQSAERVEPVAWVDLLKAAEQIVKEKFLYKRFIGGTPLANDIPCWMATFAQEHATPPAAQRQSVRSTWVGLTDEEIVKVLGALRESISGNVFLAFAQAIEAKLKERNT